MRARLNLRAVSGRAAPMAGLLALVLLLVGARFGWSSYQGARNARVPLLTSVVAIDRVGSRLPIKGDLTASLHPGTRVLAGAGAGAEAAAQRQWLAAGRIPGSGGRYAGLTRDALLDLNTLLLPNGAAVAGWPRSWLYVWPRDASFVAVALARTGHYPDALRTLAFLASVQSDSGEFQARYRPDGSGPPDSRGAEPDGIGWTLWAASQTLAAIPAGPARVEARISLAPLVDRGTRAALRLTQRPGGLPKAALDYWEIEDSRLSLGTAVPLALGLRFGAELESSGGDADLALAAGARASELEATIEARFGAAGYPRYLGGTAKDAAIAFLLPPFAPSCPAAVVAGLGQARAAMQRPAGGLAPGAGWKNDGISWTPETALFALASASIGATAEARQLLDWLAGHRTGYGALPEKVLSNGAPAGPAPLAWTAALTVLAVDALDQVETRGGPACSP